MGEPEFVLEVMPEPRFKEPYIPPLPLRPAVERERPLSDYAWIAQRDLPKACPYSEAYLPVPLADYTSGRWLEPDYTPSFPLPRPYNELPPWQCGVVGSPGTKHKKGSRPGTWEPILKSQDVMERRRWLLSLTLKKLLDEEKRLQDAYKAILDAQGNLKVPLQSLSLSVQLDLDSLRQIGATIDSRLAALTPERSRGHAAMRVEAARKDEARLRAMLLEPDLSASRRRSLEAELRSARRDVGAAAQEIGEQRSRGGLSGSDSVPGGSDPDRAANLSEEKQQVIEALEQASKTALPKNAPKEARDKERAAIDRLQNELSAIRVELAHLGVGEEGYSPGSPPPRFLPPGVISAPEDEGDGRPRPGPPAGAAVRKPRADDLLPERIVRAARMLTASGRPSAARSLIAERARLDARLRSSRLTDQERTAAEDSIRDIDHQLQLLGLPPTANVMDLQDKNWQPLQFPADQLHTAAVLEPSSAWTSFTLGTVKPTSGIKTTPGTSSADAIDEIFRAPDKFELDCAAASALTWLKATLDTMVALDPDEGRQIFDKVYPKIQLHADQSTLVANALLAEGAAGRPGDLQTIRNPDSADPAYLNENLIQLAEGRPREGDSWNRDLPVFAHPFGETTIGKTVKELEGVSELPSGSVPGDEVDEPFLARNHRRITGSTIDQQVARGP